VGAVDREWLESVFTDGHFHRSRAGGAIPVRDKASGEIFTVAGRADAADVDMAVAAATTAQAAWNERTYAERAAVLRGAAAALTDRSKQFRDLIIRATGDEALAPFGGIGQSGLGGRSGGDANIEEFTEGRWLTVTEGPASYPY
jgi:acyl-CoA reductase-like NAD-dependent aldehyde dehydrogenase